MRWRPFGGLGVAGTLQPHLPRRRPRRPAPRWTGGEAVRAILVLCGGDRHRSRTEAGTTPRLSRPERASRPLGGVRLPAVALAVFGTVPRLPTSASAPAHSARATAGNQATNRQNTGKPRTSLICRTARGNRRLCSKWPVRASRSRGNHPEHRPLRRRSPGSSAAGHDRPGGRQRCLLSTDTAADTKRSGTGGHAACRHKDRLLGLRSQGRAGAGCGVRPGLVWAVHDPCRAERGRAAGLRRTMAALRAMAKPVHAA